MIWGLHLLSYLVGGQHIRLHVGVGAPLALHIALKWRPLTADGCTDQLDLVVELANQQLLPPKLVLLGGVAVCGLLLRHAPTLA